MKLIRRNEIIQFNLLVLISYQTCLYGMCDISILENNKFNNYLIKNKLFVSEELLDDTIKYLLEQ